MSGYLREAPALRELVGQGVPFVPKPFSHATLLGKLREVLDTSAS
jgi:hypothetical protein